MNKDKKVDLCVEDAVDRLFFPVLILPEYIIVIDRHSAFVLCIVFLTLLS